MSWIRNSLGSAVYGALLAILAASTALGQSHRIDQSSIAALEALHPQQLLPSAADMQRAVSELAELVRLGPNGQDTAVFSVRVVDQNGQPAAGVRVQFSVRPIHPLGWWRDLAQVKARYGGSNGWSGKRLLGTVSPAEVVTDRDGRASTTYQASHIGGDDPARCGEEHVIATIPGGGTAQGTILLGYTNIRLIQPVAGGLEFTGGAAGRYAQRELAEFLEGLGGAISAAQWPHPLKLTDASYPWGGMIPPHSGHLHGATIDARPMATDGGATSAGNSACPKSASTASNYDRERTRLLAQVFKKSGAPVVLFNDSEIAETTCAPGHHNHLHASWLSASQFAHENPEFVGHDPGAGVQMMMPAGAAPPPGAELLEAAHLQLQTAMDVSVNAAVDSLRRRLGAVTVDGRRYYVVEGDILMDDEELRRYAEQRSARAQLLDASDGRWEAFVSDASPLLIAVGEDGRIVRWSECTTLNYRVDRSSFAQEGHYRDVVELMAVATADWERTCGVDFQHRPEFDGAAEADVLFTVRGFDSGGRFIAAAFFPNDAPNRRLVLIDPSFFSPNLGYDKAGVLRHELGHVLGFRHEHIRSEAPPECPNESPGIDVTAYDPRSVMHYFCGGVGTRDLEITEVDRTGSQLIYGQPRSRFRYYP